MLNLAKAKLKTMESKKSWINNTFSQAEIIGWLGLSIYIGSIHGLGYMMAMIGSLACGIVIRSNTPK